MTAPSQFLGKYILTVELACKTGLHIGGTDEGIEIGGAENPVARDPISGEPYVPGSSLKGKLRSLTEWSWGLIAEHSKHTGVFAAYECSELGRPRPTAAGKGQWRYDRAYDLARIYGPASDDGDVRSKAGPTRLTVRDGYLTEASRRDLERFLGPGLYTEVKSENFIDRVTSEAVPRTLERAPRTAVFACQLIVDIYEESDRDLIRSILGAMALLEDSALGGGGSRGHGRVRFTGVKAAWRSRDYYMGCDEEWPVPNLDDKGVRQLAAEFEVSRWTPTSAS